MILCAGEALIDMLPRKTAGGEDAFAPYPGGAVFNTSIALGRLGEAAGLFTGVSRDLFGQRLEAALAASQVDTGFAARSDRPTTLAFVTLTEGHAQYAFYDEGTAGRLLSQADLPGDLANVSALFFGGISLAVTPCADTYAALCAREAARVPVMLDPNIRPSFIGDEAAYRARITKMVGLADIVKVSDEDLHWLEGAGDSDTLARAMLAHGPKLVCITRGAEGVTAYTREGQIHVPAARAEVVDTVGAGDTFNAGLLAGLSRAGLLTKAGVAALPQDGLRAALALGAQAASITVSRAGANPPWAAEL